MSVDLLLSSLLAVAAVFIFIAANLQNTRPVLKIVFLAGLFLFLMLTVAHLIADFFTNRGIDESVVFHLVYGLKGAGFAEYTTLIVISVSALVGSAVLVVGVKHVGKYGVRSSGLLYPSLLLLILSLTSHPIVKFVNRNNTKTTFTEKFEDYYRQPVSGQVQTGDRKNLVFIYAEGLERTWLDEKLFPGVAPNLTELRQSALDFTNISQMPYTSWTIAGIVASQCGLPLVTDSHGNGLSGSGQFLPSAVCIGDVLKENGYRSEFYGGADLTFAGKGRFFRTHGFSSVNGIKELAEFVLPSETSTWGLYDDDLLEFTFTRFEELSASETPFAMFTLTLDTHHPKGMPSKTCDSLIPVDGSDETSMHVAVRCSDLLISRFIRKIHESSYAEQTLVVLVSDHLAMKNAASAYLEKADRKSLFMIMPGWAYPHRRVDLPGSMFDVGATTMSFLGIKTPIGFGRDILKNKSVFVGHQNTHGLFRHWSQSFTDLWGFPNLQEGIISHPSAGELIIGHTTVKTPVLIKFDLNLETQLVFGDFSGEPMGDLDTSFRQLVLNTPFAYVANCENFNEVRNMKELTDACLLLGRKGGADNKLIYLKDSLQIGKDEFTKVIQQPKLFGM